jgi:hypothetical protein
VKGCNNCFSTGWVCENHSNHPWSGLADVEPCCGGAGSPCPICNEDAAITGFEGGIVLCSADPDIAVGSIH